MRNTFWESVPAIAGRWYRDRVESESLSFDDIGELVTTVVIDFAERVDNPEECNLVREVHRLAYNALRRWRDANRRFAGLPTDSEADFDGMNWREVRERYLNNFQSMKSCKPLSQADDLLPPVDNQELRVLDPYYCPEYRFAGVVRHNADSVSVMTSHDAYCEGFGRTIEVIALNPPARFVSVE